MGSKGSQTTTTNQNQSYTADPRTQQAAGQALSGAESAAAQPFQMPVAPVAGFNPQQQQAFNQYSQIQGMAQPYYNQAAQYTAQSAAPITGADVNNYYNPMADNVTKQLQNIYGQQNVQNQGNLTAQAGGVGADRIAVGMGNLANQQGLASGQIYSQLYQQALQAAQQQKQMAAGAGSAFAGYGTGAQTAALQGTGALGQSGQIQQQQQQAELNAPYQNELARIAYQFQTPQYLAGIAGGLAPALGGTTIGNQNSVTTPPQPSTLSQILGIGTAGAGLYGAFGGGTGSASYGGGNAFTDAYGGSGSSPLPGLSASDYGYGFAEGGEVEDQGPAVPGISIPKAGHLTPVPMVSMPMGAGHSGPLTGGMSFPTPQQSQGSGETVGGDIGSVLKTAASVLPFFLNKGGSVPRYEDGGDIDWGELGTGFPTPKADSNIPDFSGRFKGSPYTPNRPEVSEFNNPNPVKPGAIPLPTPYPGPGAPSATPKDTFRLDPSAKPKDEDEEVTVTPAKAAVAPPVISNYMLPRAQQPYPDSLKRDWGQDAARSPWMALVKAGATMAATPGPIGSVIGKGILAGTTGLEGQRKELRTEQELNDKAQKLYQDAQFHLDKYTRMTPSEEGNLAAYNKSIDQSGTTGIGMPKEIEIKRVMDGLEKSLNPEDMRTYMGMTYDQRRAAAIRILQAGRGAAPAAAAPTEPGSSKDNPLPFPGKDVKPGPEMIGKYFIAPDGKVMVWGG